MHARSIISASQYYPGKQVTQSLRNRMHSIYQKPNFYIKKSNAQKMRGFQDSNSHEDDFGFRPITTESRIVVLKLECCLRPMFPKRTSYSPLCFEHEGPYCSNRTESFFRVDAWLDEPWEPGRGDSEERSQRVAKFNPRMRGAFRVTIAKRPRA